MTKLKLDKEFGGKVLFFFLELHVCLECVMTYPYAWTLNIEMSFKMQQRLFGK